MIRTVIGDLRKESFTLPLVSHIHIAISGGADSTALAVLLLRYGRRVVDPKRVRLLHVNHGWRAEESDRDEAFVVEFGRRFGVPVDVVRLEELPRKGDSWERDAREKRKAAFARLARKHRSKVLTAHTADDLVETVLWRLFDGKVASHGEGIYRRHGVELRPFLAFRRTEIEAFLKEEDIGWREDSSNRDERFLRVRIRRQVLPAIEGCFPQAFRNLLKLSHSLRR